MAEEAFDLHIEMDDGPDELSAREKIDDAFDKAAGEPKSLLERALRKFIDSQN